MKLRILKKKNPSKLQRFWIKHLVKWIKLETEYKSIRKLNPVKKNYGNRF